MDWKVALVGDSVLDNHYWLKNPVDDVREQLERSLIALDPSHTSTIQTWNFAVDESTVRCVLYGRVPGGHYQAARLQAGMDPYPVDSDGVQRPLELLRKAKPSHVVLSIGGNDARARFLQSRDPKKIAEMMVSDGFVDNLHKLIETIKEEITPNIILVYVYMPQFTLCPILSFLPPASTLQALLVNFSGLFIDVANKYSLPLIDLSRTFDPNNGTHYGSTPIEPSNISGQFIVDLLLKQVMLDFRFGEETGTRIYSGVGKEMLVQNASPGSGFNYASELQDFLDMKAAKKGSNCSIT
ncbi:unnamed protein product [Discosporangium mesarthrocarpum]